MSTLFSTWNSTSDKLPVRVKEHIKQVYSNLVVAAALCCVGLVFNSYTALGYTSLWKLVTLLFVVANTMMFRTLENLRIRSYLFFGLSFAFGCGAGPLVDLVIEVEPSLLYWVASATLIVFLCFSGAAIVAERKSYLYLGSLLSVAVSGLLWLSIFSFLIPSSLQFILQTYVGLLVFAGYVLYDTQMMIERAYSGVSDSIADAMMLFTDLYGIFVRILVIMLKNSQDKSKEKKKRRN
eukprot:jgi/Galph1/959/GphlegSOOS_G5654.1